MPGDPAAVVLYEGDCLHVMATMPDASVDAVVTDPPYLLGFMGRRWDTKAAHEHLDFHGAWAAHAFRLLKPGGHLLAFGGTRTWHRLACAVEDAGFEIRDSIAWLYGSGFPKSLDVGKAIDRAAGATRDVLHSYPRMGRSGGILGTPTEIIRDVTVPATDAARQWQGWGTALKPAFEPIVVARKPLVGTVAANVLAHGTGALNVDGCRVNPGTPVSGGGNGAANVGGIMGPKTGKRPRVEPHTAGRWPTNAVLDEDAAAALDEQTGTLTSGANPTRRGPDTFRDAYGDFRGQEQCTPARGVDTGGASRFYPVFRYQPKAPARERPKADGVAHATVKPLELMRWLVRLVCPPGGLVLDPFAGTGTTGEACVLEGFRAVLIEREADYQPLIVARLARADLVETDGQAG